MATYDIAQRSAVVTGAGSGIGRAIANLLAENGATVVVSDLDGDAVDAVVGEISSSGGTAIAHVGDVADPEAAPDACRLATDAAPLKIAVNNAGPRGGLIVNIASIFGSGSVAQSSAYVAAKHAVVGLCTNAAVEFAPYGVRVNSAGSGFIETPRFDANLDGGYTAR